MKLLLLISIILILQGCERPKKHYGNTIYIKSSKVCIYIFRGHKLIDSVRVIDYVYNNPYEERFLIVSSIK